MKEQYWQLEMLEGPKGWQIPYPIANPDRSGPLDCQSTPSGKQRRRVERHPIHRKSLSIASPSI